MDRVQRHFNAASLPIAPLPATEVIFDDVPGAGEVAVTVVDGFEFAAVNGDQRFREEAKPLA